MSNALDQQILYLEMDDIEDNVVADASGNELNGNVQGAAQAVADKFFGTAICFNKSSASGTMDYLNVDLSEGLGHALSGSAFTVTAWINPAARLSAQTANGVGNLFFAQGSGTNQDNVQIGFSETGHLQVYLGLTTGAWFTELAENDITIGAWHFVALVFDAGRSQEEIAVYVDNTVYRYAAGTDGVPEVAAITAAHLNVGGTTETDAVYFEGSMHDVRVFDSAQSSDVVGAVKSVDLTTAATPSRQSVLIDFTLLDGSSQPTLYIVDETSRDMTTTLTIENTAARALSIPAVDTLSVDNAPFSLQFRPGVIDDSCYEALDIAATDWQWSIVEEDDSALILLAPKQNMVFDADAALSFVMTGLTAAGEGGARGTRVMLSFQSIGFPDDDGVTDDSVATVSGYRQSFMSIVNQSGKRATPLVMAFVGSNAIINDGSTENSFTISIINPTDYAVSLSTDEDAPTRFTFGLPISDDKTDVAALCTEGQAEAVVVVAEGTGNWTVEASAQAETAEWAEFARAVSTVLVPSA